MKICIPLIVSLAALAATPLPAMADFYPTCMQLEQQCEEQAKRMSESLRLRKQTPPDFNLTDASACMRSYDDARNAGGVWRAPVKGLPPLKCAS